MIELLPKVKARLATIEKLERVFEPQEIPQPPEKNDSNHLRIKALIEEYSFLLTLLSMATFSEKNATDRTEEAEANTLKRLGKLIIMEKTILLNDEEKQ